MGPLRRLGTTKLHVGLLALIAAVFRLPVWTADHHITFDEGVFLASNDLARSGLTQYQDFFASQGPLFTPLLGLGQWLSLGDPRGARTALLIAGMTIPVSLYFVIRRLTDEQRSFWLSVPVAVSGTTLLAAGPVQSDGVALALATGAFAFCAASQSRWSPYVVGPLLGAAVAVKSLHVLPIVVAIVGVYIVRKHWGKLMVAGATAVMVAFGSALIYGVDLVWDQYVAFHLAKDNSPMLVENVRETAALLYRLDLPVIVVLLMAIAYRLFPGLSDEESTQPTIRTSIPAMWLASAAVFLMGFTSINGGFARTLAFMVPALLATSAVIGRIPIKVLIFLGAAAVFFQFSVIDVEHAPDAFDRDAVERVESVPDGRWIVADDPGLIWAGRGLSHPDTVDPSFARFATGYLTPDEVRAALEDPRTCLYISVSGRFENAEIVVPNDYQITRAPGIMRRPDC